MWCKAGLFFILLFQIEVEAASDSLKIYWTGGEFEFPDSTVKSLYKSSYKYIPKNIIATRGQIVGDNVFLTLPRYKRGVPATLVRTQIKPEGLATNFKAFPTWEMQEEGNCEAIQSAVDIVIDKKKILWVLDTGIVNTLQSPTIRCEPKILAISTKTGKVLKTISLEGLVSSKSRLQYLAIDYSRNDECFVYVSDAANACIIAYNVASNKGFRVILPRDVSEGSRSRDVLYLVLIRHEQKSSELFFTYLSKKILFSIKTENLRKGSINRWVKDHGQKPARIVIIGTDNGSSLFFRIEGESQVLRWNTDKPFEKSNFEPVFKSSMCQLATNVFPDYKRRTMRVLQSNFPDFMQNRVGCGALQQIAKIDSSL